MQVLSNVCTLTIVSLINHFLEWIHCLIPNPSTGFLHLLTRFGITWSYKFYTRHAIKKRKFKKYPYFFFFLFIES